MMLAHDNYIVGKKEDEDIERPYNSLLKCIGVRYTVEPLLAATPEEQSTSL